jgi:2'-5' RNA ligase
VVETLAGLERPDVPGLRWTTADQWHVTLRFLGDVVPAEEVTVREAFARIRVESRPVAELGPATGRFGRRVLHAPVSGLEELAAATVAATASVGRPPDPRPFHGHVTLARARDRRGVDLRPLSGVALAGRWAVGEVVLVSSRLGRGPARYEVVDTRAL